MNGVGKEVARLVAFGGAWIQKDRPGFCLPEVDEITDEAREHFRIVDGRVEVRDIRQLALHVKRDLGDARLQIERSIPRSSTWAVESVQRTRQPVRKRGIDKMGVRDSVDKFSTIESVCSSLLCTQSAAGSALDFFKGAQFIIGYELREHGGPQSRRRNKANRTILRYAFDVGRKLQAFKVLRAMRRRGVERQSSWVFRLQSSHRSECNYQTAAPCCGDGPIGRPSHPQKAGASP